MDRLLLRLFEIEIERDFVGGDWIIVDLVQFLSIFTYGDGVLATFNAQRKIFAFLVGLQIERAAIIVVMPHHLSVGDGISLSVFTDALHGGSLRDRRNSYEYTENCK